MFQAQLIEAFEKAGIKVPETACLIHTGTEDERIEKPGRSDADPGNFVLAYGILTKPWEWPEVHHSFRDVADFYTWVSWG